MPNIAYYAQYYARTIGAALPAQRFIIAPSVTENTWHKFHTKSAKDIVMV